MTGGAAGVRPSVVGVVGGGIMLLADLAWLALARPPGLELLLAWFVAVAAVGAFLPGPANQVTLVRAHLAGPALVYSLEPSKLLGLAAAVLLAGVSDLADGAVARRFAVQSRLGGALDPVVDGVFFGAVAVGQALGGAYSAWLAAIVVARYGLPALVGSGLLLARRRPALAHTPLGQASTALIAVCLGGLALLHGFGVPSGWLLAASEVLIPAATAAALANLCWANRAALTGARG